MNKLILQSKEFYTSEFLTIKETWHKTFTLAIVIILLENIQLLSIYTYKLNEFENDQFLIHIRSVIDFSRLYPIIGNTILIRTIFIFLGLIFQSIFIISLLYSILKVKVQIQKKQQLQFLTLEQSYESNFNQRHTLNLIISVFIHLNQGFFSTPFIFCGFTLITDVMFEQNVGYLEYIAVILSIITLTQATLIAFFIQYHQYEYRMKNYDYLGKFSFQKVHILYAVQLLIILLSGIQIYSLMIQILGILLSIFYICFDYTQSIYVDYRISRIHFKLNTFSLVYQLILILCQYGQPALNLSVFLLILIFYPFVFYLTNQIITRQEYKSTNFQFKNLEKQIRRLYLIFKEQVELKKQQRLLDPRQSLEIYTFISCHLRECKMQRDRKMQKNIKLKYKCFCNDFFLNFDTFVSLEQMKQFAKELIGQTLEDEIIENSNVNLILIYIYFLVQVKKVPTQAIYEVIRYSSLQKQQTLKQQAIIHKLKHDALHKFGEIVRKNDLVNQRYVFKKVYLYEESLNILKNNLCIVVKQEKDFYACILTQVIDIDLLLDIGFKLIQNIKTLEIQLQLLYKTNPQNNECDTIYNIYHKYINYNKLRPKLYRREGQLMAQFIQSTEKIIYDPGSCVIQITLLQPRGNVIRYTRTFQKAIGFKDEEIQNQNINRFMPQIIANDHDLYLDNFVERGRINVVKTAVRVILGKTKSQFVVPINTRLRIETSPTEFGATALITPVNLTYGYMMLNEQGQIEELTQNMYEDIFDKHLGLDLDYVKGLDCLFFIPELAKIWESLFDANFEKLDKKFDCQLILPQIPKQMTKSVIYSRTNLMTKSQIQQNIVKQFEQSPHENIVYQITLHLVSLITINLRLVILEIPEYKQINSKVTSRQLIQLRFRSSQLINFTTQNDSTTHRAQLAALNSPPGGLTINECDLEYENLIEEMKMIEELKNQLATINITNTVQFNNEDPFLLQQSQNCVGERIIELRQEDISERSNDLSEVDSDFKQNQQEQNLQYNNGSVGSRSSQNNTTALKRQIKDCLSDSRGLSLKTKLFLLILYGLVLSGYLINYLIVYFNFDTINQNQNFENLPFEFSYFYNEFIIQQHYLEGNQFPFQNLSDICFTFYLNNLKQIDQTIQLLPHINKIDNLTMESRMLNILSQLTKIKNMNQNISVIEFLNNTANFNTQLEKLLNTDSTQNIIDLSIFVIVEEILLIFMLVWYIYICIQIVKMKTKIYKLFCTFSKEVIQESFVQYSSLFNQLNNSKFRNHETDEEQFETTMMRQYQKTVTSNMLDKHSRVGKQISVKSYNSAQLLFFFFLGIYAFMCSFYYVGSYILQSITVKTVRDRYHEKIKFEATYSQLTLSFAQQVMIIDSNFQNDLIQNYNKTVTELETFTTNLALYQQDQNTEIYSILTNSLCNLLLDGFSYSYEEYNNLFTTNLCQQSSALVKGLSFTFQSLYYSQFDYLQSVLQQNLLHSLESQSLQIDRIFSQYGFLVIVEILTKQIKLVINSTFLINTIMLAFAAIIMSISLLITKLTIQKVKDQYKESKQLLTLFPFDRLMENAYVISFITQDLRLSV